MVINPDGELHIYSLNVGQGDTTVVVTPNGNVAIIDAFRSNKLFNFLVDLGVEDEIEHLVITHPHSDHFSGANRLLNDFRIAQAIFAPAWHEFGLGPATYRTLIDNIDAPPNSGNITFLSGYKRWYPDNLLITPNGASNPILDENAPYLEFLGPTNALINELEASSNFNTNHLSIIARITWNNFRMIVSGDAQMENWDFFRREGLMRESCNILRCAHHGSKNGTQWELIDRLDPSYVIVSSDPTRGHNLPDLASTGIFLSYDNNNSKTVVLTRDSGTIHVRSANGSNRPIIEFYGDTFDQNVDLNNPTRLTHASELSDFEDLLNSRIEEA